MRLGSFYSSPSPSNVFNYSPPDYPFLIPQLLQSSCFVLFLSLQIFLAVSSFPRSPTSIGIFNYNFPHHFYYPLVLLIYEAFHFLNQIPVLLHCLSTIFILFSFDLDFHKLFSFHPSMDKDIQKNK